MARMNEATNRPKLTRAQMRVIEALATGAKITSTEVRHRDVHRLRDRATGEDVPVTEPTLTALSAAGLVERTGMHPRYTALSLLGWLIYAPESPHAKAAQRRERLRVLAQASGLAGQGEAFDAALAEFARRVECDLLDTKERARG